MAKYFTRKCPHCSYTLERNTPTGVWDYESDIGPPLETCPQCEKIFNTHRQYWDDMHPARKRQVIGKVVLSIIGLAFLLFMIIGLGVSKLLGLSDATFSASLPPIAVLAFILAVVYNISNLKKMIKPS